jgi:hypothetical protein
MSVGVPNDRAEGQTKHQREPLAVTVSYTTYFVALIFIFSKNKSIKKKYTTNTLISLTSTVLIPKLQFIAAIVTVYSHK